MNSIEVYTPYIFGAMMLIWAELVSALPSWGVTRFDILPCSASFSGDQHEDKSTTNLQLKNINMSE